MSRFLQSLVSRHQAAGVDRGPESVVQPRARSFFENDEPTGAPIAGTGSMEHAGLQTILQQQLSRRQGVTGDDEDAVRRLADIDASAEWPAPGVDREQAMPDAPLVANQAAHPMIDKEFAGPSGNAAHSERQGQGIDAGITARIRAILAQMNSQLPQQPRRDGPESGLSAVERSAALDGLSRQPEGPPTSEETIGRTHVVAGNRSGIRRDLSESGDARQRGILQSPDLMTDLRFNAGNRQHESSSQVENEPVVNVTIGRLEVKALIPEPASRASGRKKSQDIMSLDDYLQRRNGDRK